eukprot:1176867-Prymnesium_polylepis.1
MVERAAPSLDPGDITIPIFRIVDYGVHVRRFRRPQQMIRSKAGYENTTIEYEMDGRDAAWLDRLNAGQRAPLLDADGLEEIMD